MGLKLKRLRVEADYRSSSELERTRPNWSRRAEEASKLAQDILDLLAELEP